MASKPVELAPEAQEELIQAAAFYEERQSGLGDDFLDCVGQGLVQIEANPDQFPAATGFKDVRIAPVPRFSYRLPFLELPDVSRVLAVAHVRRRPAYWRDRRDS